MRLAFTKMHGLGNDFVVLDAINQKVDLSTEQMRFLGDRRFGIGCDQILLVERPRAADTEFHYRIFNSDGGEVEQCGNGARCFARFVHDKGLTQNTEIDVGTAKGKIRLYLEAGDQVRVNMGAPILQPDAIPFEAEQQASSYELECEGQQLEIGAVSMGNPHLVLRVEDVELAAVGKLGPLLEFHPRFPKRVNVGFMQVLDRAHIKLRVYERGAGETLACGTGACAAVVSGRLRGWLDEETSVQLRGGMLSIRWQGEGQPVWMTGPATRVFEGEIEL